MKQFLLPLLLAAASTACAAASLDCQTPTARPDVNAIARAEAQLASARAQPDQLALADALANMAAATASQQGSATRKPQGRDSALDLLGRAQLLWLAAPPDPALARSLSERGRGHIAARHCALALEVLETALTVSDKAGGKDDPLTLAILRDLIQVAAALDDDPTLNTLGGRLAASLSADPSPLASSNLGAYLALNAYFYRTENNAPAEQLMTRLLERARSANPQDAALIRRLTDELASVYYAQLRYKEAQALIGARPQPAAHDPRQRVHLQAEASMAARVRSGNLTGALSLGEATLAFYESERARMASVLADAAARQEGSVKEGRRSDAEAEKNKLALARNDSRWLQSRIADMQGKVGELQHALGRHAAAQALYESALGNYVFPDTLQVYEVARIRADLALLQRTRGDFGAALALQQQVQQRLLPLLGTQHPDVREAEKEIAALQAALKDPERHDKKR